MPLDIGVEARAVVYPVGHSRRTIRADLVRSLRPHVLEMGLADERELDDLDAAIRAHLHDQIRRHQARRRYLTGSTALGESTDPEALRALLTQVLRSRGARVGGI